MLEFPPPGFFLYRVRGQLDMLHSMVINYGGPNFVSKLYTSRQHLMLLRFLLCDLTPNAIRFGTPGVYHSSGCVNVSFRPTPNAN
jgi:hypothetical protein